MRTIRLKRKIVNKVIIDNAIILIALSMLQINLAR
jgi:hypothetical protein